MKKILKILIPILFISIFIAPDSVAINDRKGKKVSITSVIRRGGGDRTISPDVKVYYFQDEDRLELICHETKETSVYILTSDGEEFSCDTFCSDMTPYYSIEAPDTPGTYWIVIDSPVIYGEGVFVVD